MLDSNPNAIIIITMIVDACDGWLLLFICLILIFNYLIIKYNKFILIANEYIYIS